MFACFGMHLTAYASLRDLIMCCIVNMAPSDEASVTRYPTHRANASQASDEQPNPYTMLDTSYTLSESWRWPNTASAISSFHSGEEIQGPFTSVRALRNEGDPPRNSWISLKLQFVRRMRGHQIGRLHLSSVGGSEVLDTVGADPKPYAHDDERWHNALVAV